ncbi:MAG: FtsX-like permease family protein [Prevotellaceae bacterium]|nr:FtsX-like permease family protein [Prevotellaceae bacterium]
MNLSLYIARRYLFAPKKHRAVNIISIVSVCGVALSTMALVCTLSVFNGFQEMVAGFFTSFDPQLKITPRRGKVFDPRTARFDSLRALPAVAVCCETLEENVMLQYKDRQAMVILKGVDDSFRRLTTIDSVLFGAGEFLLHDPVVDYAVLGGQLVSELGCGVRFVDPLQVYVPKRQARINLANPSAAFNRGYLYSPGVVFVVNQEKYDAHYVLTSLKFARGLFDYEQEVTALELRLHPGADLAAVQAEIVGLLGDEFRVENRYEQQADVFRIMEIEKLISYLFLTFILAVACFNVIGSLSMLMLDKRDDVQTLRKLGADDRLVARIFLVEGRLISFSGALLGIALGWLLCVMQQQFGLLSLGGGGFVVDAYPVSVHVGDVLLVLATVVTVGFLSVWWPVRYMTKRLLARA